MTENRYFIIDYGEDIEDVARVIINKMRATKDYHLVIYKTDLPNGFMITETTELDFIGHFTKTMTNE